MLSENKVKEVKLFVEMYEIVFPIFLQKGIGAVHSSFLIPGTIVEI